MDYIFENFSADSVLKAAADLHKLKLAETEKLKIYTDLECTQPFSLLFGANAIRDLRKSYPENDISVSIKNTVSCAEQMGFFKFVQESVPDCNLPLKDPKVNNCIPITGIDLLKVHRDNIKAGIIGELGDSIERKSGELAEILCGTDRELWDMMTYLIREVLRNVPEHGEASVAWICARNISDNILEAAVLDNGIGVRRSLQKNPTHRSYITDDITALQCAVKAGISKAFNPARGNRSQDVWANSGYGLFMVSEICKKLKGSFCLASGDSFIHIESDGTVKEGSTYIDGTAVMMRLSTAELRDGKTIIQEAAKLGEAQARSIKNAFRKASRPSIGLVIGR